MSSGSTSWSSGFFIGRGSLHAAVGCQCGAASLSVINRLRIYNAGGCNFAGLVLLDRPRGAATCMYKRVADASLPQGGEGEIGDEPGPEGGGDEAGDGEAEEERGEAKEDNPEGAEGVSA